MKKNFKGFIIGVIFTLIVSNSAFATDIQQTIRVAFHNVGIMFNGNRSETAIMIYNERFYVPLGDLVNMLGKEANWNSLTNTIDIKDKSVRSTLTAKEALDKAKEYVFGSGDHEFKFIEDDSSDYVGYVIKPNIYFDVDNYLEDEECYLIHYYEVVTHGDVSHTATVNWYQVNVKTGEVVPMF